MNKKKIIISLMILILGICCVMFGTISLLNIKNKEKVPLDDKTPSLNSDNQTDDDGAIPDDYVPLDEGILIEKFKVVENKKENDNLLLVTYTLLNNTEKTVTNELLKINIYDNSEAIDGNEFEITSLEANDEITVETNFSIEYKDAYKYEIIFRDKKFAIEANNDKIYKIS